MHTNPLLQTLFNYKSWANNELFALVASVPVEQAAEQKKLATRLLNHVYVVDRIFVANLQGLAHGYTALNTPETPVLAELHSAVQATDAWFLQYASGLSDAASNENVEFAFADGKPGRMTRGEMLLHVVTHGNYHRGAVGRILAQLDITPPRDTLTVFLHR